MVKVLGGHGMLSMQLMNGTIALKPLVPILATLNTATFHTVVNMRLDVALVISVLLVAKEINADDNDQGINTLLNWMPTIQTVLSNGFHPYEQMLQLMRLRREDLSRISLDLLLYSADKYARNHLVDKDNLDHKMDNKSIRDMVREMGWLSTLSKLVMDSRQRSEELRAAVLSPQLPQSVIDGLALKTGSTTSCVQLFLCKMAPLVWAMQHSASDSKLNLARSAESNWDIFWQRVNEELPDGVDLVHFGKKCDQRFPTCPLITFRDDNNTLH